MENNYELIYMSRQGDEWSLTALFEEFKPFFLSLIGDILQYNPRYASLREDMMEETKLSVLDALEYYREDQDCQFSTFVYLLARRRLLSMVRYYQAKARIPLRELTEVDGLVMDNGAAYDVIKSENDMNDPVYYTRYMDAYRRFRTTVEGMRAVDQEVIRMYMEGVCYKEAGARLGLSARSYDGRLQRIKKKIRRAIMDDLYH
ncbi:MAG: sigma-70 family RNA polymerase sigma factor [Solobacterium sp.]|nr:sigma-70 family RNA polymerase sigma factor [Solobacterium sp.]